MTLNENFYNEIVKDLDCNPWCVPPKEGRPEVVKPDPKKFNDDIYAKQRRNRLGDIVGDYLNDEEVTPRQLYEELLAEVDEWVQYHQRHLKRFQEFQLYIHGQRPVDL
ncbi:hypothetical protein BOW92_gp220 [Synechococcus phage S-WAM1]|jgi:hypothetical protein|uniref:Uncharacterized protein n=1 Tax=Synechococcus phage S-WAM1 TaxID=1815521 RepID=A0A1D8KSD8_9CAUD|nr:hypothetical protein BOW92_gp220 [Synechococcus phage S-WAM1]AOV61497.1 hypothetical protein P090810_024 [Synechococcus phage S-WAM1]